MGLVGKKPEPRLAFFRELAAQVRALPGMENWAENEGERTVSYRLNGLDFTATFDNLFADTQTLGPEARAARIRTFLQNVVAPLPSRTWEDARANLRVALRAGPPIRND